MTDPVDPSTPEREAVKPCPWCGSTKPPTQRETDGAKWGALACAECSATAPEVRTGYGPFPTWYDDALVAWNDRPAEAAVRARALADVAGWVEKYRTTHGAHNCTLCAEGLVCHDAAADYVHNAVLDDLLANLREAK